MPRFTRRRSRQLHRHREHARHAADDAQALHRAPRSHLPRVSHSRVVPQRRKAAREIAEELGLQTVGLRYNKSEYFEKNNTLMLNFSCIVASERLDGMTDEVDQAEWFSIEAAKANIKKGSLAQRFLENYLEKSNGLKLVTALKAF